MTFVEMGFSGCFKAFVFLSLLVVGELNSAESRVHVRFDQTPPDRTRFSTAVFLYNVQRPDGSNACKSKACSFNCQLDGQLLSPCPDSVILLRNLTLNQEHTFLLNVTTPSGETNSSAYSWFIDTIPPTATISSEKNYTSAGKISIDITFSEACGGNGGFKCLNSSNCDVTINGPAHVDASSLHVMKPNIKYRLHVILSSRSLYERVVITMEDGFCRDTAGNSFTRTNSSILVIHFDRRPVLVDLWTSVPSYNLGINGVARTVFATNKRDELKIFLDFSVPVLNSTEQILAALSLSSGNLVPLHGRDNRNLRFGFELKNIPETEIISIELQAGLIIGRTGTAVSAIAPLSFLYDSLKPEVGLSTSSPRVTKETSITIVVEFTKPVFGFEASMVEVGGGRVTRFKELSRALYSLTVLLVTQKVVSIRVSAGKVNDISGNPNLASNRLEVKHYLKPPISAALHSFVTVGTLATSIASAVLSLSGANLEALGTLDSLGTNIGASDPSTNLHGMIGHLQVFVLSDWFLPNSPVEYSETMRGLRWLIPRQKIPWKKESNSIWPNHFNSAQEKLTKKSRSYSSGFLSDERDYYHHMGPNLTELSHKQHKRLFLIDKFGGFYDKSNISAESSTGLPLSSSEYFAYFLRGEPLSAINVVKKMENYKGWEDLEMNLFWLGISGGSLLIIHVLILLFLRQRTGKSAVGILLVPRFELLLIILMLPCISQSSAFVIRGSTPWGIVAGALLLSIPAAFILSVCLFLIITVFSGSYLVYKEVKCAAQEDSCNKKFWLFFIGNETNGKWFYQEGLPSSFLSRFGILFENLKGPPVYIFVDQNDQNTIPTWTESGENGIGRRRRVVSSDDIIQEIQVSFSTRVLGCARSFYIVIDLLRRVCLGVLSGLSRSSTVSQTLLATIISSMQLVYLIILRPYIRRGVQVAEIISLSCEIALFGLSISTSGSKRIKENENLGFIMLALFFVTLIAQLTNTWYTLIKLILKFSPQPEKDSFRPGLKFALKGFVLLCLPRKHWPSSFQPRTESEHRDRRRGLHVESFRAMTATVVPVHSPSSPRRAKGLREESKGEMKKLRELAKASFSMDLNLQDNDPQASTSKTRH